MLSRPWATNGRTFSDRIWSNRSALVNVVQTELTQAIIRGDNPSKIADVLAKRFNTSKNNAGRLAMTESAYISQTAQKDCFVALDVEKYEIVEALDSTSCELCQSLDGTVLPMKEFEPGVTAPPFHPWCRGCTAPWFPDDPGQRVARGEDGELYYVPSNMSYSEWKKKFVDGSS